MLSSLITPLTIDAFLDSYYAKSAYYSAGDSTRFQDLFQWSDVNDLLSNTRAGDTSINLVGKGKKVPFVSVSVLRQQISDGQTIEIDNLQEVDPAIRGICDACSADFNTEVNINAYVSHPSAQGFNLHYDLQDVFIVQTEGIKRWYVYEPSELWPTEQGIIEEEAPENTSPYLDIELKPGDVLYIPRGHWHKAIAVEPCVHLTVTVPFTNGVGFLTHVVEQLSKVHPIFRKDLPIHDIKNLGGTLSEERLDSQLNELVDGLMAVLADRSALKQYLYQHVVQNSPISKDIEMPTLAIMAQQITSQTQFIRNLKQACMLSRLSPNKIVLLTAGQTFQFEDMPISLITRLLKGNENLSGDDLIAIAKEEGYALNWDDVKKVILALINHGVLSFTKKSNKP